MTLLGQGSDEVTEVPVPVLVRSLLRRACHEWRLGHRRTGRPQASLDRAAGTNQEIERRSRRTEASRLCLAWRTGSLQAWPCCLPQRGLARSSSGAPVVDA